MIINYIYKKKKHLCILRSYRDALAKSKIKKVIVGSNIDKYEGWVSTNFPFLDITKFNSWFVVLGLGKVDNILGEHVWEHLSINDGYKAIMNCYFFLRKGGVLKIAVPDGFHKNPDYIEHVRVGGIGIGADDHKCLYNHLSLTEQLERAGFSVKLIEYWDEEHQFHKNIGSIENGIVKRSFENDPRNANGEPNYTSLIIEAIKL